MSNDPNALYSRKNPFPANMTVNRLLTGEGSEKETRHYEISLAGSEMAYEVGDSLGVFCTNCPDLVEEMIRTLHATGDEEVASTAGGNTTLRHALLNQYQITQPDRKFLGVLVEKAGDGAPLLRDLMDQERRKDLEDYLWGMEIIDFLKAHPSVRFEAAEFVGILRKLQPRLYSIASSLKAYPAQVHLTVASVRYESHGRQRKGVCSTFLADRVGAGVPVPVFVHTAKGFRLPEDLSTDIIMVGPGTGVAPFRAFIQERKATGATGRNWLFFGDQRRATDFLYEEEFVAAENEGVLTKFDTAFSRDQAQKVYVQHRMEENAAEIWDWIEKGAHFFVCGDASRMAKDVDVALHKLIEIHGGKTPEQAAEYVESMKKEKRYKRDVY